MSYFNAFSALFLYQIAFFVLIEAQNEEVNLQNVQPQAFPHKDCPAYDDAAHPVQFGFPYDCGKYYSCLSGLAYLLSCPIGLHWSSLTYRCDYPAVAKCQPLTESMLYTPKNYESTLEYRSYAGDCSKYLQCQVLQCPRELLWNAHAQRCDLLAFATCATHQSPGTSPTILPTYVPPITQKPHISPPTAATPPPTLPPPPPYVPQNVPWPMSSTVGNDTEFPIHTNSPYENELDQLCSKTDAEYIHYPGDCHRFIQCNGFAYVLTCPANLYWNSELLTCDRYCK